MIGDSSLSEQAKLLEEAAKKEDREYIDANHEAMMTMYDRIVSVIRSGSQEEMVEDADDAEEILEFAPADDEEGGRE